MVGLRRESGGALWVTRTGRAEGGLAVRAAPRRFGIRRILSAAAVRVQPAALTLRLALSDVDPFLPPSTPPSLRIQACLPPC